MKAKIILTSVIIVFTMSIMQAQVKPNYRHTSIKLATKGKTPEPVKIIARTNRAVQYKVFTINERKVKTSNLSFTKKEAKKSGDKKVKRSTLFLPSELFPLPNQNKERREKSVKK